MHHHSLAGAVVYLLNLLVVLNLLDDTVFVVWMGGILFGKDQLLPPCSAFNRQVDQRDNTVQIIFAHRLDIGIGAGFCIRRPFFIACADQLAGYARQDRIGGYAVGFLMVQGRCNSLDRIHVYSSLI